MILIAFGTRPEFIKLKPVMEVLKDNNYPFKIAFTGQHLDLLPPGAVSLVDVQLTIEDKGNRLDSIVASIMNNDYIFEGIRHVMVQGDTTSAFAMALAAFHRKIPVIHLEAGLRTYNHDNPYPEEFNRQAISRIATVNLCPTKTDGDNLLNERVPGSVFVVGNTVLDSLKDIDTSYSNKVLITMHRRENHDKMDSWLLGFNNLANKFPELDFCFVSHPNPNVQKFLHILEDVEVLKPMPYIDFIKELAQCRFIITDSGGLQEESSFLRKKSIVCREYTERVDGVGTFSVLCKHPRDLYRLAYDAEQSYIVDEALDCPYGNGHSADTIFNLIKDL